MKIIFIIIPHYFLLLFLIFFTSCSEKNATNSNNKNPLPQNTSTELISSKDTSILNFSSRISIIFQDSKNNYWFAAQNEGICRFDGKRFNFFKEQLDEQQVRAIQEDKNGNIWLGFEGYVKVFDGQNFITIQPEKESQLITQSIPFSMENFEIQWKKERAWMWYSAFNKNGVYRFDGKKLSHFTLPVPENYPDYGDDGYHPDHGYDIYAVYGIYKDKTTNLWFGTAGGGLFRYDGKSIVCINEKEDIGVVRAIYEDSKGAIWFGNNAKGINVYDKNTTVIFSKTRGVFKEGFVGALDIEEDKNGNIWFAQFDTGLWRYNPKADKSNSSKIEIGGNILTQFTADDGLKTNFISTLYKDNKEQLWIGTGNGDIFIFNGKTFDEFKGIN